jgi:hypothetical protein
LRIEFPPGSRRKEGVCFSAAQLGLDAGLIEFYRKQQPTISEHQQTIAGYLRLRPFDDAEAAQLERKRQTIHTYSTAGLFAALSG